jgi:hypothetical protein
MSLKQFDKHPKEVVGVTTCTLRLRRQIGIAANKFSATVFLHGSASDGFD